MTTSNGRGLPLKKLINGAGLVWSDLKRTIGAASAVVRYLTMRERIEVAIGGVSAEASVAVIGQPSRYVVRIVNVGDRRGGGIGPAGWALCILCEAPDDGPLQRHDA
jgi:hypothetical protein